MRNHSINLFVEDFGHETFLDALLRRFAEQYDILIEVKRYIRDLQRSKENLPDLIIAATDGNCKGFSERKHQIDEATKNFSQQVVCAIPDPHIERWLLLDSAAFKKVLGKGCSAPVQKCERDLYKRLLLEAVRQAGVKPLLGGIEYTEDLVGAMNLDKLERTEESLGKLLKELRHKFQEWDRSEHTAPQEIPGSQSSEPELPQA